jgi:hypothetical protein
MTPNRPGDSRIRGYAAGLNIPNFPPESVDPPNMPTMFLAGERQAPPTIAARQRSDLDGVGAFLSNLKRYCSAGRE